METIEQRKEEMKKAYYGSKSHKKLWLIIAMAVIISVLAYFLMSTQDQPVDIGVEITVEDVTYSAEGLESEELLAAHAQISSSSDAFSVEIKRLTGYNWTDLVTNPTDGKNSKSAAVLYFLTQVAVVGFEYGYVTNNFNVTYQGIMALPIEKVDASDTSKENLLLTISYFRAIEEWYKEKGFLIADADINRLDFLYHYFDVVEINPDELVVDNPLANIIIPPDKRERATYEYPIKTGLEQYNAIYTEMVKLIEITNAQGAEITVNNIGREDIDLVKDMYGYNDISVYVNAISVDCQWSVDVIKPGEDTICVLEEPCTNSTVMVVSPGGVKEMLCS